MTRPAWQVVKEHGLDAFLFEALNSEPDWSAESRLHASLYGSYKAETDLRWRSDYRRFGIPESFDHGDENGPVFCTSNEFHIAYDVFRPDRKVRSPGQETVLVLTHGVPVNRREWYDTARLLARFFDRVVVFDLLGMGDSAKPLRFRDPHQWYWSWRLHARILGAMLSELFPDMRVFIGGNDWGGGTIQAYLSLPEGDGVPPIAGAILGSTIALNGYWVQHIGALTALAKLPYPSSTFDVETIRFIGTFTALLETMFHRTPNIHNQYTMAPLQAPYAEVSAYWNVRKNPDTTNYNAHAVRVLAEQASVILGNGELLPYHPVRNQNGLRFTNWNVPVLLLWGKHDKMVPEGQVHRFRNIVASVIAQRSDSNQQLSLWTHVFKDAGHFAVSDQPEIAADTIIQWIMTLQGPTALVQTFLGFNEIARQDEEHVMHMFNDLHAAQRDAFVGAPAPASPTRAPSNLACHAPASSSPRRASDYNGRTWTEQEAAEFRKTGTLIGRGGHGAVYINDTMDPTVAIKYSTSSVDCATYKTEFVTATHIRDRLRQLGLSTRHASVVRVIQEIPAVTSIEAGVQYCAVVMDRVFRPSLPDVGEGDEQKRATVQAYFGADDPDYVRFIRGRGMYIGPGRIREAFARLGVSLEAVARSFGELFGFMHYGALVDAGDMEFIVGSTEHKDGEIKLFAVDFDRVQIFTPQSIRTEDALGKLQWSISQEEYLPAPGKREYDVFKQAYMAVAGARGYADIAQKVLTAYEDFF